MIKASTLALAIALAIAPLGCGSIEDRKVGEAAASGGANGQGGSGANGQGGSGANGQGGSGASSALPPDCETEGTLRCNGNTVETCDAEGTWVTAPDEQQCGGANRACSGDGVCAPFKLSGTIDTFGELKPAADAPYVLRDQSLLQNPKTCNADHCVTGGLRPDQTIR